MELASTGPTDEERRSHVSDVLYLDREEGTNLDSMQEERTYPANTISRKYQPTASIPVSTIPGTDETVQQISVTNPDQITEHPGSRSPHKRNS